MIITGACKKINIGESLGLGLVFCQDCKVVELEIGAVIVRLCPDVIQHVANVMMKAILQLDQLSLKTERLKRALKNRVLKNRMLKTEC